jgi:cytidine deaminase
MTVEIIELAALDGADRALLAAAQAVSRNAHAPYSRFFVGAAARFVGGVIRSGANFENVSYGLSLCAEAVLLASASSEGLLPGIEAIAIAAEGRLDAAEVGAFIAPCGRCRQLLAEAVQICGHDIPVLMWSFDRARVRRTTAKALLPLAFGAEDADGA